MTQKEIIKYELDKMEKGYNRSLRRLTNVGNGNFPKLPKRNSKYRSTVKIYKLEELG